jgi:hypothetical protein
LDFVKCFGNRYIDNWKFTQSLTWSPPLKVPEELRSELKKIVIQSSGGEKVTEIVPFDFPIGPDFCEFVATRSSFHTSWINPKGTRSEIIVILDQSDVHVTVFTSFTQSHDSPQPFHRYLVFLSLEFFQIRLSYYTVRASSWRIPS